VFVLEERRPLASTLVDFGIVEAILLSNLRLH
jgi:hypothetical protein